MNKIFIRPTVFFLLLTLIITNACAQSGTLDNSFNLDGIVITDLSPSNSNDMGNALAIQSDDKTVVAGYAQNGSSVDVAVARYLTNGSIDSTFGTNGVTLIDISGAQDYAYATCLQPDGKILIAGYTVSGGASDFIVMRFKSNGIIDSTFGINGIVATDMGGDDEKAYAMSVQTDGKILVAGYTNLAVLVGDFAVARYNSNGSLDSTFNFDGKTTTSIGTNDDVARSIAIQPDGKIVAAGYSFMGASPKYDFSVVRYNSDGSLDNTFDVDGINTCNFGSSDDQSYSISIQSNGNILLAGYSNNGGDKDFALVRYLSNGTLDYSFDLDGKVTTNFGSSNDEIKAMTIQPDDKIIVTGRSVVGVDGDISLARYMNNGSLDISFDSDGMVTTNTSQPYEYSNSIGLQSDGKIVIAGAINNVGGFLDFAVLRYNNTLTIGIPLENQIEYTSKMYPNPLHNSAHISFLNMDPNMFPVEIKVLNIFGQYVYSQILNSDNEEIKFELQSGNYYYQIYKGEKLISNLTGRFIVY